MNFRSYLAGFLLFCLGSSCSAHSAALGAFVGNNPADLIQFEKWLGKPVDQIAVHTGRANWADWVGSIKRVEKFPAKNKTKGLSTVRTSPRNGAVEMKSCSAYLSGVL